MPDALVPWDGAARAYRAAEPAGLRPSRRAARHRRPGRNRARCRSRRGGETTTVPLSACASSRSSCPTGAPAGGTLLTSFHVSASDVPGHRGAPLRIRLAGGAKRGPRRSVPLPRRLLDLAVLVGLRRATITQRVHHEPQVVAGLRREHEGGREARVRCDARFRVEQPNGPGKPHRRTGSRAEPERWCDYLQLGPWLLGAAGLARAFGAVSSTRRTSPTSPGSARRAAVEGAPRVLARGEVADDRQPGRLRTRSSPTARDGDDLDIWAVLTRRFYGRFTSPRRGATVSGSRRRTIGRVRKSASVWSYTYSGVAGTPGLRASEPLSNPRVLVLWNALEGLDGLLYGQGTTTYGSGNPLDCALAQRGVRARSTPAGGSRSRARASSSCATASRTGRSSPQFGSGRVPARSERSSAKPGCSAPAGAARSSRAISAAR